MPKVLSGGYREDVSGVVAWENMASFVCQWYRYEDGTTHAAGRWVNRDINYREELGGPDFLPSRNFRSYRT